MNIRHRTFGPATIAMAALVVAVALPLIAHATHMRRLAANFAKWDGSEFSTSSDTSSPLNFYTKTVTVPFGNNVIYVTLSATGDGHDEAGHLLRCRVDGAACNGGSTNSGGGGAGWIGLQQHGDGDDFHDNAINYTWCKPITPGSHQVKLDLASDDGETAFMEGVHVYIDVNKIPGSSNACTDFDD